MEPGPFDLTHLLPYIISILGLIGSSIAGVLTYRERKARQASDIIRTRAEASDAEASATQRINEAAAAAVDTLRSVHEVLQEDMEHELKQARDSVRRLAEESEACIEKNRELMKENAALKGENIELRRMVLELTEQNKLLEEKVDLLRHRIEELEQFVDKYIGLTDMGEELE